MHTRHQKIRCSNRITFLYVRQPNVHPPGDALLLCISVPQEKLSVRLKVQFAANSFVDGKGARVNFMQMLDSLGLIDRSSEKIVNPIVPPESQIHVPAAVSTQPVCCYCSEL